MGQTTEDAVRDALQATLAGSGIVPDGAVVTDAVAIVGYLDADDGHGVVLVDSGCTPWATEGLLDAGVRLHAEEDDGE